MQHIPVVLFGLFALAFAFVVSQVGSMILQLAYVLFGVLGGPLLGMFALGILFPWANKWGGGIGLCTSLAFMLWIGLGTTITKTSVVIKPPMSLEGCNYNLTDYATVAPPPHVTGPPTITTDVYDKYSGVKRLYTMSYIWYSGLAVCVVVVVGLVVSFITGPTDPKTLNPKLICPVFDVFFPWLPERIRKRLRFGVRHGEKTEHDGGEDLNGSPGLYNLNMEVGLNGNVQNESHKSNIGTDNIAYDPPYESKNVHL